METAATRDTLWTAAQSVFERRTSHAWTARNRIEARAASYRALVVSSDLSEIAFVPRPAAVGSARGL